MFLPLPSKILAAVLCSYHCQARYWQQYYVPTIAKQDTDSSTVFLPLPSKILTAVLCSYHCQARYWQQYYVPTIAKQDTASSTVFLPLPSKILAAVHVFLPLSLLWEPQTQLLVRDHRTHQKVVCR
jgi:hypothetical protein